MTCRADMGVLESVTCIVLALLTFAVFRKEILKVKDVFVGFWIPQKREKVKHRRKESNKENIVPSHFPFSESVNRTSSPMQAMDNSSTMKEIISTTEMTKKVTEETEGLRIKSATLLPAGANHTFENFSSEKLVEKSGNEGTEAKTDDPFPLFSEILQSFQGPSVDNSSSSRTEEVKQDDNSVTKITREAKHEVRGNTEMSFTKTEQESISKSTVDGDRISSPVALDAMDLNNLINETQKRLDSFKSGFKTDLPIADTVSSKFELKKTETSSTSSSLLSGAKSSETVLNPISFVPFPTIDSTNSGQQVNSFQKNISEKKEPPPVPPKPKTRPLSDPLADSFSDCLKEMQLTLNCLNGGLGFTSGENSTITTETEFGSTMITKKKKMFSSSSFYEEPGALYPTVEEQVEMARKIADSLADDTNKKSKGANMFYKRVKRSSKWIHEGPELSDESGPGTPEIQGLEPPTPDPTQVPFRPSKGPQKLKLVLDPRHPLDANALRSSGLVISEHNVVSPDVCHGLVKDLHSPVGKGAALFAKRKKKSEEWVVDEERVKTLLRETERKQLTPIPQTPSYNQFSTFNRQDVKLVKSPWEAAMESPYGRCDAAFARVRPEQLADTVFRAADEKRRNSNTPSSQNSRAEGCLSPVTPSVTPAAAYHDIYHAKAPRGWTGTGAEVDPFAYSHASDLPVMSQNGKLGSSQLSADYTSPKKMAFQNFNTVPRLWKPMSMH